MKSISRSESDDPNRASPTGVISGWKNIVSVLTLTYGYRLVIH